MITNNWHDIKSAVHKRDRSRCMNCRQQINVIHDVHHVVPRGASGAHAITNLILLCRRCHDAVHNDGVAPRVEWTSTGDMNDREFHVFRELWNSLDIVRYDDEARCWYIPIADAENLVNLVETTGKTTGEAFEYTTTTET